MGFGAGVFFLALGAILRFATNIQMSGIDLGTVGVILMLVGAFWLVLAFSMFFSRRRRTVVTQRRMSSPSRVQGDQLVEERHTYEEPMEPPERY